MTTDRAGGEPHHDTDEDTPPASEDLARLVEMPKVELHVHLEGAIRPETLLELAHRNHQSLPADTVEGVLAWYKFTDFPHFVEVYLTISRCIRKPDDIELITRDFLIGQAAQNILHTEATYTAITHYRNVGISFDDQMAAIGRARAWALAEHGMGLLLIIDIPRDLVTMDEAEMIADWVIDGRERGVAALGLAGNEVGYPAQDFASVFDRARGRGVPAVVHAGETTGPESVWAAMDVLHSVRIGHGVRSVEDPELMAVLRERQLPLEVCPSSNVCLGVVPDWPGHPLPTLVDEGLHVTLNSDDPPMFDTTLTAEYERAVRTFGWDAGKLASLSIAAAEVTLLDEPERTALVERVRRGMEELGIG